MSVAAFTVWVSCYVVAQTLPMLNDSPTVGPAITFSLHAALERVTQSLDGQWQIEDGKSPTEIPAAFTRTVPVPGLANLANPAFPDVDKFVSRENLANKIRSKLAPAE